MNGYGEFHWKEGKFYIGYFENNKKTGFGIYVWSNPVKIFIGYWKNGKQHGLGKYISNRSIKYGIWNEGERETWLEKLEDSKKLSNNNFVNSLFYLSNKEIGGFIGIDM